jgi:hypothetical protein
MFELETAIARWRESMQAAGISPGPVRDELESHLRESFDSVVQSGMSPDVAFSVATENLGAARDLRREYNLSLTRWARLKRFLGRRVELFPSDMTICAWAAIPGSLCLIYKTIESIRAFPIDARHPLTYGLVANAFWALPAMAISSSGLFHAVRVLVRKSPKSALQLAFLWTVVFWVLSLATLMLLQARNHEFTYVRMNDGSLTVLAEFPPGWAALLTLATAVIGFMDWSRRLPSPDDPTTIQRQLSAR